MATTDKYLTQAIIPSIKAKVDAKQDKLIGQGEGQNIKTVNGENLLGTGDVELPAAQLYATTGQNTDGAMTQKAASDAIKAVSDKADANVTSITSLEGYVATNVQLDTTIKDDKTSTVTIVKKQGALNNVAGAVETELPLPVASETQAGVINPATYQSIQNSAEKIENLLGSSVAVADLPATPTQEQLTAAWKTASGKDTLINGASIFDSTNNKTWTYYSNTATWSSIDNANPTVELTNFTNTAAGQIKGDNTTDGKVQAEADGTGSVKGWDTVKTDIANNTTEISTIKTTLAGLGDTYALKTTVEALSQSVDDNAADITALQADKQDKLVGSGEGQNIKTVNGVSLLGAGNVEIAEPQAMTAEEFEAAWNA